MFERKFCNFEDGKIIVECTTDTTHPIDTKIISELIVQVYQFLGFNLLVKIFRPLGRFYFTNIRLADELLINR